MDILRLTAALILGSLTLSAFFVVLSALFPRRLARVRAIADAMPGRSLLVGLVNLVFFSALVIALIAVTQWTGVTLLGVPALVILAAMVLAATFGLGGAVELVGQRLLPQTPGARRTIVGTLALGWACALPFLGWFAMLPLAVAFGLGALILSFFSQGGRSEPVS